jgi:hypothetical protein
MKKIISAGIIGMLAIFFSGIALADDLTLTFTVPEVSNMATDVGDGITLTLVMPAAGNPFSEVTDTFTVSVSDNTGDPMKVTLNTELAVPAGITLTADASAGLGTPGAEITITNTAQDLITGIQSENGSSTVTLGLTAGWNALAADGSTMTLVVTYCADS